MVSYSTFSYNPAGHLYTDFMSPYNIYYFESGYNSFNLNFYQSFFALFGQLLVLLSIENLVDHLHSNLNVTVFAFHFL